MALLDSLLNTSTISSEIYCTGTTTSQTADTVDEDSFSTTITSGVSTAITALSSPTKVIIVHDAMSYVESLSCEELANLDQALSEKEFEFTDGSTALVEFEEPKVYHK